MLDEGSRPPPAKWETWGLTIANYIHTVSPMLPPGEYKWGIGCACYSDYIFCQITLVVVLFVFIHKITYSTDGQMGMQQT